MPQAQQGNQITSSGQFGTGVVDSAAIATDTIVADDIAANAVGDSEIAAHTTTKITSPFSLVTGTVPINQGGTGQTTQTAAFDALDPLTTQGDIIYHNGTNSVRLGAGTSGQFLKTQGAGANPVWAAGSATVGTGQTSIAKNVTSEQLIAHGMGVTPSLVQIYATRKDDDGTDINFSHSFGTGTSTSAYSCTYVSNSATSTTGTGSTTGQSSTQIIVLQDASGGTDVLGTISTLNSTNIGITLGTNENGTNDSSVFIQWTAFK